MRKIINIFAVALLLLTTSCSWLDVDSDTVIMEEDLYTNGDGYRTALNGIYIMMADDYLYGKELTYGLSTVISENYENNTSDYNFGYYTIFLSGSPEDETLRVLYDAVWSAAFKVIANLNNMLLNMESATPDMFAEGEEEMNLIKGEAIAIRALLHFEMLRLFGYAINESGAADKRLPYVKSFDDLQPEYLTTAEMLDNIIADLQEARDLIRPWDIDKYLSRLGNYRFNSLYYNDDIFFSLRGTRLNYLATTILLSRAYMFKDDLVNAQKYAEEIYAYGPADQELIKFSVLSDNSGQYLDQKMYYDLLFATSNKDAYTNYSSFTTNTGDGFPLARTSEYFSDDTKDFRLSMLISDNKSLRWRDPNIAESDSPATVVKFCGTLSPVIRFSEVYHIIAECKALSGDVAGAAEIMNSFTVIRGEFVEVGADLSSEEMVDYIRKDYCRESMDEGRISWLYRRVGTGFNILKSTLPLPRSETDYMAL